jgi:endonuclease YncB( thermonuclease family)
VTQKNELMKSSPVHRQLGWSHSFVASLWLCFIAMPLLPNAALGQTSEEVVITSCYDGDTCTSSTGEKIRLACIDTPELRGKHADPVPAKEARDYLRELVVGSKVTMRRITNDRYGRTVAELFVDGSNVQQQLVASGHASIYWRYAYQCPWIR